MDESEHHSKTSKCDDQNKSGRGDEESKSGGSVMLENDPHVEAIV